MSKFMQNVANNRKVKKFGALFLSAMMCCVLALSASAVDTSEPTPAEAATQVFETIHDQLNFTTILSVIAVALCKNNT